jgi:hypothetical protein
MVRMKVQNAENCFPILKKNRVWPRATAHGCVPPVVGARPKHVGGLQRKSSRSSRPVSPLGPARSAAGGHHDYERWGPCCPRASECDQPHLGSSSPSRASWRPCHSFGDAERSLCLPVCLRNKDRSLLCVFCVARATGTTCELVTVNIESTVHEPIHRFHLHLRTRCSGSARLNLATCCAAEHGKDLFVLSFVFWLQKEWNFERSTRVSILIKWQTVKDEARTHARDLRCTLAVTSVSQAGRPSFFTPTPVLLLLRARQAAEAAGRLEDEDRLHAAEAGRSRAPLFPHPGRASRILNTTTRWRWWIGGTARLTTARRRYTTARRRYRGSRSPRRGGKKKYCKLLLKENIPIICFFLDTCPCL